MRRTEIKQQHTEEDERGNKRNIKRVRKPGRGATGRGVQYSASLAQFACPLQY